ncbi:helix-turn-helix domain-containing protein [Kocuria rhizophila]|uniref:helix-turn-helix domain-containing protein n=1 Tax=Kocuria rhizophila TaxID=72000 RepID=UPI0009E91A45|nr:helix-turn-helix transcriptional regulator [Kocuria rhizophila]
MVDAEMSPTANTGVDRATAGHVADEVVADCPSQDRVLPMSDGLNATSIVGERLRRRRDELDLSARHVARLANIDMTNYARLERGTGNPTLFVLIKIAHALDTSIEVIVGGLTADDLPDDARVPFTREEEAAWIARTRHGESE